MTIDVVPFYGQFHQYDLNEDSLVYNSFFANFNAQPQQQILT
jgi:hypothetical protein